MEIFVFLSAMTEAFEGKRLIEGLESRALGFFLTSSTQISYNNVVYPWDS